MKFEREQPRETRGEAPNRFAAAHTERAVPPNGRTRAHDRLAVRRNRWVN